MTRSTSHRRSFRPLSLTATALIALSLSFAPGYAQSVTASGAPRVNGDLTVHALDTTIGQPAAGLAVELFEVSGEQPRSVVKAVTNSDGRADIIAGRPLAVGRYELQFAVADYFRKRGSAVSDPPFLDIVPVRFFIEDPTGSIHVPFVFSSWSYAVFR